MRLRTVLAAYRRPLSRQLDIIEVMGQLNGSSGQPACAGRLTLQTLDGLCVALSCVPGDLLDRPTGASGPIVYQSCSTCDRDVVHDVAVDRIPCPQHQLDNVNVLTCRQCGRVVRQPIGRNDGNCSIGNRPT